MMSKYTRNCPECQKVISYCYKFGMLYAERDKTICKGCASKKRAATPEFVARAKHSFDKWNKKVKSGEVKNGFEGRHHTEENKKHFSETRKGIPLKPEHKEKVLRGMHKAQEAFNKEKLGCYGWWLKKYGKEEADKRMDLMREKHRINATGSKNNMYGKPSPAGSGNGWSGWYNEHYFRSLRELMFLIYADRFQLKLTSLEKRSYKIVYTDPLGVERNYFADYLVNDKYFIEIKPKKLQQTPNNKAKYMAALEVCKYNNWEFRYIDPKINSKLIKNLWIEGRIAFLPRYEEKIKEYYSQIDS